jgi:hypothetical protein
LSNPQIDQYFINSFQKFAKRQPDPITPIKTEDMKPEKIFTNCLLTLSLILSAIPLSGQVKNNFDYHPEVGQEGKDVVWVPTPQVLVEKMLEIGKVTPNDILYDLGSGDGRTVITAAKRGVQAYGFEYNPDMVRLSRFNAEKEGVSNKATFIQADLFETDLSKATVITMFLLPQINMKLRPKILDLKPGTRIVSNTFDMEDWQADDTATVDDPSASWNTTYLWIVPAKVNGVWKSGDGEVNLIQTFQFLSGTVKTGGKLIEIKEGRMRGSNITFTAAEYVYSGNVTGDKIEGTVSFSGKSEKWNASR